MESEALEVVELLSNFLRSNGVVNASSENQLLALAASDDFVQQALNRGRLLDICEYILLTYPHESGVRNDDNTIRLCIDIVGNVVLNVAIFSFFSEYRDLVRYCARQLPWSGIENVLTITSSLRFITHLVNSCPENDRICLSELVWSATYADCLMILENCLDAAVIRATVYLLYCVHCQVVEQALSVIYEIDNFGKYCNIDENVLVNIFCVGLHSRDGSYGNSLSLSLLSLLQAASLDGSSETGLVWTFRLLEEVVTTTITSWEGAAYKCSEMSTSRSDISTSSTSSLAIGPLVQLLLSLLVAPKAHQQQTGSAEDSWESRIYQSVQYAELTRDEQYALLSTLYSCLKAVSMSTACSAVQDAVALTVGDCCIDRASRMLLLSSRLVELLVEIFLMRSMCPGRLTSQYQLLVAATETLNIIIPCSLQFFQLQSCRDTVNDQRTGKAPIINCRSSINAAEELSLYRCCVATRASTKEFLELLEEKDVVEWLVQVYLTRSPHLSCASATTAVAAAVVGTPVNTVVGAVDTVDASARSSSSFNGLISLITNCTLLRKGAELVIATRSTTYRRLPS